MVTSFIICLRTYAIPLKWQVPSLRHLADLGQQLGGWAGGLGSQRTQPLETNSKPTWEGHAKAAQSRVSGPVHSQSSLHPIWNSSPTD